MNLLKKKQARQIFKNKCWLKANSLEELDTILEAMLEDMANTVRKIHLQEHRAKATAQDIRNAYKQHKEAYLVTKSTEMINRIIAGLEKTKQAEKAYYGP